MLSPANRYLFSLPVFIYAVLRQMICLFRKMCTLIDGAKKVVDIGCGNGVFTLFCGIRMANAEVLGFDPDEKKVKNGIKAADNVRNVTFICGEFQEEDGIGTVCLSDVLHHMERKEQEILI